MPGGAEGQRVERTGCAILSTIERLVILSIGLWIIFFFQKKFFFGNKSYFSFYILYI